jgi:hypothetical protein
MVYLNKPLRDKHISSVEACLSKKSEIRTIIEWCSLESVRADSWRLWCDGYGYNLEATEDYQINLSYIKPEQESTGDILAKSGLNNILRHSDRMILTTFSNNYLYWLLGKDNKLRLILIKDDEQKVNLNPFFFGMKMLQTIVGILKYNKDTKRNIKLKYSKKFALVKGKYRSVLKDLNIGEQNG